MLEQTPHWPASIAVRTAWTVTIPRRICSAVTTTRSARNPAPLDASRAPVCSSGSASSRRDSTWACVWIPSCSVPAVPTTIRTTLCCPRRHSRTRDQPNRWRSGRVLRHSRTSRWSGAWAGYICYISELFLTILFYLAVAWQLSSVHMALAPWSYARPGHIIRDRCRGRIPNRPRRRICWVRRVRRPPAPVSIHIYGLAPDPLFCWLTSPFFPLRRLYLLLYASTPSTCFPNSSATFSSTSYFNSISFSIPTFPPSLSPQIAFGIHQRSNSSRRRSSSITGRWPPSRASLPSRDPPAGPSRVSSICQRRSNVPPSHRSPQRSRLSTSVHRRHQRQHRRRRRRHQRQRCSRSPSPSLSRSRLGRRYVNTSTPIFSRPTQLSLQHSACSRYVWSIDVESETNEPARKPATRSFTPRSAPSRTPCLGGHFIVCSKMEDLFDLGSSHRVASRLWGVCWHLRVLAETQPAGRREGRAGHNNRVSLKSKEYSPVALTSLRMPPLRFSAGMKNWFFACEIFRVVPGKLLA